MATAENHLIALLPRKDRVRLLSACEAVELVHDEALCEQGRPTQYAYFPIDGVASLVLSIDGHPALEVGMVGREGMLGVQLAAGVASDPMAALVATPGAAWRIDAPRLQQELAASPALQRGMSRYFQVLLSQLATAAGCLRFHQIGPRLARWLLMTQDRKQADHFHVTHEFLARMLGVRRVGITVAASALQRDGLVVYHRGEVEILDRPGLEGACCSCYSIDRRLYADGMR